MALDPSIALQTGQGVAPINPLGMANQAQGLLNAQNTNKLQGLALQTGQQGLASTQQKAVAGIAVSALSQYDPQNPGSLVHALHFGLDQAVAAGVMPQAMAKYYEDGIAQSKDPAHLVAMVRQTALQAIDPNQALARVYGAPATMSNGQYTQPGVMRDAFMGGGFTPTGGAVRQMLTPGEKAAPVTVMGVGPDGNPVQGQAPLGTTVNDYGDPRSGGAAPIPGDGSYRPGATAPEPGQQASANPPGFRPTAAPMGVPEQIKANQEAFRASQGDMAPAYTRMQGLSKANEALKLAITGVGSSNIQKAIAFLNTVGIPVSPENATNYPLVQKYLTDYARNSTTGPTNEALTAALNSNASGAINNTAALDVVRTNMGRERQAVAATMAAPSGEGNGFIKHKGDFTAKTDPVAFAADMYTPQELQKHRDSLKGNPVALQRFYDGLAAAAKYGFVAPK